MSLLGQYKSGAGVTLNGAAVSAWEDQSGNGNNLEQTTAINQPAFVEGVVNGHPALRFTGSEFLQALTSGMLEIGLGDLTLVTVMIPVTAKTMRMCGKGTAGASDNQYQQFWGNSGTRFFSKVADGVSRRDWGSQTGIHDGINFNIFSNNYTASSSTFSQMVDGNLENVVNGDVGVSVLDITAAKKFQVGDVGDEGTIRFEGDLLEVSVYDSVEDMSAIYAELNALYSVPPVVAGGSSFAKMQLLFDDL